MATQSLSFHSNIPPTTQLEIRIACSNLASYDLASKSDPAVSFYFREHDNTPWVHVGTTETVKNKKDVTFMTPMHIPYHFAKNSFMRFVVLDMDNDNGKIDHQDFIGYVDLSVPALARQRVVEIPLMSSDPPGMKMDMLRIRRVANPGNIRITGTEVSNSKDIVTLGVQCRNLEKMDLFSSDPYVRIERAFGATDRFDAVHKLKTKKKNRNPIWKPFEVTLMTLCGGDIHTKLRFTVMDWDKTSKDDLIGSVDTTLQAITEQVRDFGSANFPIINPTKVTKRKYNNSGHLTIYQCNLQRAYSFYDFVSTGTEVCLSVAIDFTGSNGNPTTPGTLHYLSPANQYEMAIHQVGRILEAYDTDRMIPAYGFGGVFYGTQAVGHCHPLTGNMQQPEVHGIDELIDLYRRSVAHTRLSGPTNFAPVIRQVTQRVRHDHVDPHQRLLRKYSILLILTDGDISDMQETKQAIYEAANCAMSIIIVGVGTHDFALMEELDSDNDDGGSSATKTVGNGNLNPGGGRRDIVQFVPFARTAALGPDKLAYETLAEVPDQIARFAMMNGIKPRGSL